MKHRDVIVAMGLVLGISVAPATYGEEPGRVQGPSHRVRPRAHGPPGVDGNVREHTRGGDGSSQKSQPMTY